MNQELLWHIPVRSLGNVQQTLAEKWEGRDGASYEFWVLSAAFEAGEKSETSGNDAGLRSEL